MRRLAGDSSCMAEPGPHASDKLLRLERLDDVVVGPGFQTQHDVDVSLLAVSMMIGMPRFRADSPADVEAAHAGQHEIEQDDIRLGVAE